MVKHLLSKNIMLYFYILLRDGGNQVFPRGLKHSLENAFQVPSVWTWFPSTADYALKTSAFFPLSFIKLFRYLITSTNLFGTIPGPVINLGNEKKRICTSPPMKE